MKEIIVYVVVYIVILLYLNITLHSSIYWKKSLSTSDKLYF